MVSPDTPGLCSSRSSWHRYFIHASGNLLLRSFCLHHFQQQGYRLTIESPDDLDPDNRTTRGDTFDMSLSIIDNSDPSLSATVVVEVDNITVWGGLTDSNGTASPSILVKPDRDPWMRSL